ncbi:MAG: molybdopterin molybdotransferase MoeA [Marmoricola sp.]
MVSGSPLHFCPVAGEIHAGPTSIHALQPGSTVRIMTGAALPEGADAVVPFEWTDGGVDRVEVRQAPSLGQHVRRAGEDVTRGDVLVKAGEPLDARRLAVVAAVGIDRISTPPRPRVAVMSTGAELVEPGEPLRGESIYDSNSYLLAAAVRDAGGAPVRVPATPDDPDAFLAALESQLDHVDAVVTTGGVSKGTRDVVKAALQGSADHPGVVFREVAMQPGKPQGFGVLGPDRTPLFALPGNPVSTYVSFELFVAPALRAMIGRDPVSRPSLSLRTTEPLRSIPGKRQFLRGRVGPDDSEVAPVGGPGSHLLGGLSGANALIVLAEDVTGVAAGEEVPVLLLDRDF